PSPLTERGRSQRPSSSTDRGRSQRPSSSTERGKSQRPSRESGGEEPKRTAPSPGGTTTSADDLASRRPSTVAVRRAGCRGCISGGSAPVGAVAFAFGLRRRSPSRTGPAASVTGAAGLGFGAGNAELGSSGVLRRSQLGSSSRSRAGSARLR
ncbi:hypothetical protein ACHAWF_000686, partial [Thalassiosira exigua]